MYINIGLVGCAKTDRRQQIFHCQNIPPEALVIAQYPVYIDIGLWSVRKQTDDNRFSIVRMIEDATDNPILGKMDKTYICPHLCKEGLCFFYNRCNLFSQSVAFRNANFFHFSSKMGKYSNQFIQTYPLFSPYPLFITNNKTLFGTFWIKGTCRWCRKWLSWCNIN